MKTYKPHSSSFGDVSANIIAILCYVSVMLFWVIGIVPVLVIFFMEKKSGLVRFHGIQSVLLWLARTLLGGGITFESIATIVTGNSVYLQNEFGWGGDLPIILIRLAVDALVMLFACLAIANAYNWRDWKIPLVGLVAKVICDHSNQAAYNGELDVPAICEIGVDSERPGRRAEQGENPPQPPEWESPLPAPSGSVMYMTAAAPAHEGYSYAPTRNEVSYNNARENQREDDAIQQEKKQLSGEDTEGAAPADGGLLDRVREMARAKRYPYLEKKDPEAQLPPDMRDPPPPFDMYGGYWGADHRAGKAPGRLAGHRAGETRLAAPPLTVADDGPVFVNTGDLDKNFDQMMYQGQHMSVLDRASEWFSTRNRPLAAPVRQGDPNAKLPPEMRDPPPAEML